MEAAVIFVNDLIVRGKLFGLRPRMRDSTFRVDNATSYLYHCVFFNSNEVQPLNALSPLVILRRKPQYLKLIVLI